MALLIFANGMLDEVEWIRPYLTQATAVWAADGGSKHLFRLNHLPDRVIGDMDSLPPEVEAWLKENEVPFVQHPPAKEETDLELALLLAAEQPAADIWLFGLLGGRLDQMLANIFLLTNSALNHQQVQLITPTERAWLIRQQTEIIGEAGDTVSLIPLSEAVTGVTTSGLVWPLRGETLHIGQARSVSNQLVAETAVVLVKNGLLLCIQARGESHE